MSSIKSLMEFGNQEHEELADSRGIREAEGVDAVHD
jgi:hypothetical protein